MDNRWVYRFKWNYDNTIKRFKAGFDFSPFIFLYLISKSFSYRIAELDMLIHFVL